VIATFCTHCSCLKVMVQISLFKRKADVLHFALSPFCSWGLWQSRPADYLTYLCLLPFAAGAVLIPACRLFDIAVLMSSSHRCLICALHVSPFFIS
jgi:hypothetical protein